MFSIIEGKVFCVYHLVFCLCKVQNQNQSGGLDKKRQLNHYLAFEVSVVLRDPLYIYLTLFLLPHSLKVLTVMSERFHSTEELKKAYFHTDEIGIP